MLLTKYHAGVAIRIELVELVLLFQTYTTGDAPYMVQLMSTLAPTLKYRSCIEFTLYK